VPLAPGAKALLQMHACVVLWGFTAILGKLITLPALPLVWWRLLIVVGVLALLPRVWRGLSAMPKQLCWAYAGVGALVALHWVTFFGSIKLSNASVGATCMAFAPIFTALIEPTIAKRNFAKSELFLGVIGLVGVALVVGGVQSGMRLGIAVGIFSALLVAIFGSLNKLWAGQGDALSVTALQLGAGLITLTLLAPVMPLLFPAFAGELFTLPTASDTLYLLALSLICTLLPFTVYLIALRNMSAFSAQLALNLEPVYTILLAILLFNEQRELSLAFYSGVVILLAAVVMQPLLQRRKI
jgi:drug/metabolite transporter (DMT)-like permease